MEGVEGKRKEQVRELLAIRNGLAFARISTRTHPPTPMHAHSHTHTHARLTHTHSHRGTVVTWRCRFNPIVPGMGWHFQNRISQVCSALLGWLSLVEVFSLSRCGFVTFG